MKLSKPSPITRSKVNFIQGQVEAIRRHRDSVAYLTGVSNGELRAELICRTALMGVLALLLGSMLPLEITQQFVLICVAVLVTLLRTRNYREKIVKRYQSSVESDFSEFVETLALAVNSGLSFVGAFIRTSEEIIGGNLRARQSKVSMLYKTIARLNIIRNQKDARDPLNSENSTSSLWPLQRELDLMSQELKRGVSLSKVLDNFAVRLNSPVISDFVDAVVLTLARGTPLALLLNDHAQVIRENQRRVLLERAGRAEIKMMVPVIFLLLPISVLFALWPSFQQLQQLVTVT